MNSMRPLQQQLRARRQERATSPSQFGRLEYTVTLILAGFGVIDFNPTSYADAQSLARVASQAGWTTYVELYVETPLAEGPDHWLGLGDPLSH